MDRDEFTKTQQALGYDNAQMAAEIGLSERMVAYMKTGQRSITLTTAGRTKDAIKRKIDDLKVLHKCVK